MLFSIFCFLNSTYVAPISRSQMCFGLLRTIIYELQRSAMGIQCEWRQYCFVITTLPRQFNSWSGARVLTLSLCIIRSKMGHRTRTPQPQLFRWIVIGKRCTRLGRLQWRENPRHSLIVASIKNTKRRENNNRNGRKRFTGDKSDNNIDIQIRASSERTERITKSRNSLKAPLASGHMKCVNLDARRVCVCLLFSVSRFSLFAARDRWIVSVWYESVASGAHQPRNDDD